MRLAVLQVPTLPLQLLTDTHTHLSLALLHTHTHATHFTSHSHAPHPTPEYEYRDSGAEEDVDDEFDDDAESVKGMARLFCEVAEAYIQLILAATPQVRVCVDLCV
jgi:hypothetical protein